MPWQNHAHSKTLGFTNLTADPYIAIPSDLVRAGAKRSRCALRRYCGHKLRVEIPCCHDFTRAPNEFSDGLLGDYQSAQVHGFRDDVCLPRVFEMDGTGSLVSLSGMTLLRNLRNHEQVINALRDELATPSVTKATLPSRVFWSTSPTSDCCRWINQSILQWTLHVTSLSRGR